MKAVTVTDRSVLLQLEENNNPVGLEHQRRCVKVLIDLEAETLVRVDRGLGHASSYSECCI